MIKDITEFIKTTMLDNKPYYLSYKLFGLDIVLKTRNVKNTLDFFNINIDKKKFDVQVGIEISVINLVGSLVSIGDINYEKMTMEQRYNEICQFNGTKYIELIKLLQQFEDDIAQGYEEAKKL